MLKKLLSSCTALCSDYDFYFGEVVAFFSQYEIIFGERSEYLKRTCILCWKGEQIHVISIV